MPVGPRFAQPTTYSPGSGLPSACKALPALHIQHPLQAHSMHALPLPSGLLFILTCHQAVVIYVVLDWEARKYVPVYYYSPGSIESNALNGLGFVPNA